MSEDEVIVGCILEDSWLTLEQMAAACGVEPGWLLQHLQEGLIPHAECLGGTWRFSGAAILRTRRMLQMERDFDAAPELAALVADLLEEIDRLRARLHWLEPSA
ncbi:MAG: chaperone modulator CbpM [Thiobacillaceae bacterium]|nr:chaperone modulator CbpM [Thiobacillaceae bacterium]MCX7672660.1 chaperone modulator CbpM [Thiobacillaceae bacterium]MDW8323674.1 chaperone modulator CbpM [Burkholderiales bacterium]